MAYRPVDTKFWSDNYIMELDSTEKLVFLYCLTNSETNIAGIYEMNLHRMGLETGYEVSMLKRILERFTSDRKIYYIEGYIVIRNFMKYQNLSGWKTEKGIKRIIDTLPERLRKFILLDDKGLWLDVGEHKGDLTMLTDKINVLWDKSGVAKTSK